MRTIHTALTSALTALCVLALTACSQSNAPQFTALPYSDDFSNPQSGWTVTADLSGDTKYDGGVMRITVKNENLTMWSVAGKNFKDVVYEVDMKKVEGPDDNGFGVIFGMKDRNTFCHFDISSDGYWRAGTTTKDKGWQNFADWLQHQAILPGDQLNKVSIALKGESVTFSVNGQQLETRTQPECTQGDIGVFALTQIGQPGVSIAFDNVSVKAQD
jgi:hypothetical protein